jgi:hypothetical protein
MVSPQWQCGRGVQLVNLPHSNDFSEFCVFSNKPEDACQLLSPGTQWPIKQLAHLRNPSRETPSDLSIAINHGKLTIAKSGFIKDYQMLDDFVRFGLELFDQLMLTTSQGVTFVDDASAVIVDDVKCPICSEVIRHDMVVCVRCKTPHCLDCWQYNGQCATFACQEVRYHMTFAPPAQAR